MGYTVYLVLFYYQGSIKDSRVLLGHLAIAALFAKFCLMLLEASQFFTYKDIVIIFINIKNSIIVIIIILVIVIIWINIIYKTIPICIFVIFIIIIIVIIPM